MKTVLLKSRYKWINLHSLYNELIKNPPENYRIETLNPQQKSFLRKFAGEKNRSFYYRTLLYYFGELPYISSQLLEPSVKYDKYDLIFASQHVIKSEQPWIVDFEYVNALNGYLNLSLSKNIISKRLKSRSCKVILPFSNWAESTLRKSIDCKEFNDKIRVVRVTFPPRKRPGIKKNKSLIRILWVGSSNPSNIYDFVIKGLNETVDAFIDLQKKYDNLELVIRSAVSSEIKEKVKKYSNIKILNHILSSKELDELYQSSDICPHAGFSNLNAGILEPMSYGLPVIATSLYNIPELIKNMENGILIQLPNPDLFYTKYGSTYDYSRSYLRHIESLRPYMIQKIKEAMALLIEDSTLRQKLGREAVKPFENDGEFSVKRRQEILKEVFDIATS